MVVSVVPLLLDGHRHLLGVDVGDGEAACGVACGLGVVVGKRILLDGIGDLRAIRIILGKVGKRSDPVPGGIKGERLSGVGAVGQKVHGNGGGGGADPLLLDRYRHLFGVGVGDRETCGGVAGGLGVVVGDCVLLDSVGDLGAAVLVLREVRERARPVVGLIQGERLSGVGAVGQKVHGDGSRLGPDPGLGDLDLSGGRSVLVGDRLGACDVGGSGGVALDGILLDGIDDLGAVIFVLGQVREAVLPAVGLVQGHRLAGIDPVGEQVHGDGSHLGPDPGLGDTDLGGLLRCTVLGDEDMAFGVVGLHLELAGGKGVAVLVGEGEVVLIITGGSLGLHEAILAGGKLGELDLSRLGGRAAAEVRPRTAVLLLEGDLGTLECLALGADFDELRLEGGQFHVADEAVERGLACCGLSLAVVCHSRVVGDRRVLERHRIVHRDVEQPRRDGTLDGVGLTKGLLEKGDELVAVGCLVEPLGDSRIGGILRIGRPDGGVFGARGIEAADIRDETVVRAVLVNTPLHGLQARLERIVSRIGSVVGGDLGEGVGESLDQAGSRGVRVLKRGREGDIETRAETRDRLVAEVVLDVDVLLELTSSVGAAIELVERVRVDAQTPLDHLVRLCGRPLLELIACVDVERVALEVGVLLDIAHRRLARLDLILRVLDDIRLEDDARVEVEGADNGKAVSIGVELDLDLAVGGHAPLADDLLDTAGGTFEFRPAGGTVDTVGGELARKFREIEGDRIAIVDLHGGTGIDTDGQPHTELRVGLDGVGGGVVTLLVVDLEVGGPGIRGQVCRKHRLRREHKRGHHHKQHSKRIRKHRVKLMRAYLHPGGIVGASGG